MRGSCSPPGPELSVVVQAPWLPPPLLLPPPLPLHTVLLPGRPEDVTPVLKLLGGPASQQMGTCSRPTCRSPCGCGCGAGSATVTPAWNGMAELLLQPAPEATGGNAPHAFSALLRVPSVTLRGCKRGSKGRWPVVGMVAYTCKWQC